MKKIVMPLLLGAVFCAQAMDNSQSCLSEEENLVSEYGRVLDERVHLDSIAKTLSASESRDIYGGTLNTEVVKDLNNREFTQSSMEWLYDSGLKEKEPVPALVAWLKKKIAAREAVMNKEQ